MCNWHIQLTLHTILHKNVHFFTCCLLKIAFILYYYFIYFILGDFLLFGIYCEQQRKHYRETRFLHDNKHFDFNPIET